MILKIHVLVPPVWSQTDRGSYFENLVAKIFTQMQFKVTQQIRVTGMEIDLFAVHLHSREKAYVECKFSKDHFGAPVITKLVGNAMSKDDISVAYLVTTSEPSKDAKGLLDEYKEKGNLIRNILRFAYVGPKELINLYLDVNQYPRLNERLSSISLQKQVSAASLTITPDIECWVLEKQVGGIIHEAVAIPLDPKANKLENFEKFRKLVEDNKAWPGLQILNGLHNYSTPARVSPEFRREVIIQIPRADRFDDYNPARPEDFVGRTELQKDFFDFVEKVRKGDAQKRVVALSGPSGFGKSSVILKLADRTCKKHYRNKFYLYHIDSRSATSPLFVSEALRAAFQKALDDGFINIPGLKISIDSIEDPFSSESIQECLSSMKAQGKVLIIFFDQFEELLTKEALFSTFEVFKKAAFIVEALQSNFLIAFSWRTGISFPEDHPAYHMWHSLRDKRFEIKIGLFSDKESSEMLSILEKYINQKLESSLRRHLLEQAQGFPWFLKKLCVHVFVQLNKGTSQRTLLERKLDAPLLFEEDTRDLPKVHISCLKYIAEHSPVDLVEIQDSFGIDVIDSLYHNRLVVRSGYKYSVYWDIFREFLVTGEVPQIPMTYFPQAQLTTSLSVLRYIAQEGPVSVVEIENDFKYTIKTIWNIVGDLSAFFLTKRRSDDKLEIVQELKTNHDFENAVAEYVAKQLKRHIVLRVIKDNIPPGQGITQSDLESLGAEFYPSISKDSIHIYMNRILSWLRFTGLADWEPPDLIIRPKGIGQEKGRAIIRQTRLIDGKALFLCTSSPNKVIDLATKICREGKLSRTYILKSAFRNAAQDLTSLEIAQWKDNSLSPIGDLQTAQNVSDENLRTKCATIIEKQAFNSRFLKSLEREVSYIPEKTDEEIINAISHDLGRDWHPASARRYCNGGMSWLKFFGKLDKIQGQLSLFEYPNDEKKVSPKNSPRSYQE